jgi:hypothetical protein
VAVDCFRYFGFTTFEEVDRITFRQYQILAKAHKLRQVDEEYRVHEQAFLNLSVQRKTGSKKNPRYFYQSFKKFFNYEKYVQDVERGGDPTKKLPSLLEYMRQKHRKGQEWQNHTP